MRFHSPFAEVTDEKIMGQQNGRHNDPHDHHTGAYSTASLVVYGSTVGRDQEGALCTFFHNAPPLPVSVLSYFNQLQLNTLSTYVLKHHID